MMTKIFQSRTKAPTSDIRWYGKDNPAYGGKYSMFDKHDGKYGNCTHYAIGRYQEVNNKKCKLINQNADKFLDYAKKVGYKTGMTPKLGAIVVWKHTKQSNGHVGVVEKIYSNGDLDISMSGWKSYLFKVRKVTKKSGYVYSDYKLLGFIYPEDEYIEEQTIDKYSKGTYEVLSPRYVRTGAGTEHSIKKVKELTKDGQKNVINTKPTANAQYKKGTKFTALEVVYAKNKSIWAKTPSGYVCLESSKGTVYCKKSK